MFSPFPWDPYAEVATTLCERHLPCNAVVRQQSQEALFAERWNHLRRESTPSPLPWFPCLRPKAVLIAEREYSSGNRRYSANPVPQKKLGVQDPWPNEVNKPSSPKYKL